VRISSASHGDGSRLDLGKIRMSLIRFEQVGARAMNVRANSTCLGDKLPSGFS